MARIIGVEVPPNKRIDIALRYIYGIGPVNALEILERANIDRSIRAKDLTERSFRKSSTRSRKANTSSKAICAANSA